MKPNFQLIILIIFITASILGVLVFSGAIPLGKNETGSLGTVVIWGTVPGGMMLLPLEDFNKDNPSIIVKYVQKSIDTFDEDLLEALATKSGPDMIFLPENLAFHYANKIVTIPYSSYGLSSFKNTFASAGEVFLNSKGFFAFPITIDPLMMYYNRSILDANGVVNPPTTWDDLIALIPTLTNKDDTNKIIKPAVALGHFSNVKNAKDIIATLFMQVGNPIIVEKNGIYNSALDSSSTSSNLSSILKFYTDFADPNNKATYSWNRSFANSDDTFSRENLAFYFGFASELPYLVNKNPNQNFFIAPMPQIKNSNFKLTASRIMGLAVLSSTKNFNASFAVASLMATGKFASSFASSLGIPPARRDLLSLKPEDSSYAPIFNSSALFAKSWLDPSPKDTNNVFSRMVNSVLSNNLSTYDAIKDASSKMQLLLIK